MQHSKGGVHILLGTTYVVKCSDGLATCPETKQVHGHSWRVDSVVYCVLLCVTRVHIHSHCVVVFMHSDWLRNLLVAIYNLAANFHIAADVFVASVYFLVINVMCIG